MTSADREQLTEEWKRTPHAYDLRWPEYCCAKCGLWPGYPIHELPAGAGAPDPAPAGHHRRAS